MTGKNIIPQNLTISKKDRNKLLGNRSFVIWFTGLSGSGKSTLANETEKILNKKGYLTYILDGDNIRGGLNRNLTFSEEDRKENIRRIGEVAKLMVDAGIIVITAFISPFREDRDAVRKLLDEGEFIEVYLNTPVEKCEERDVKGLYKKAREGEIKDFTGINSPYEVPLNPEVIINTAENTAKESVNVLLKKLEPILKKI
ncbi:MAG TPA: adenylyl-sulfate kinase [Ignavibacteria bacterium]|nr:adenylyl-sulfate kinase [Bacteroidota bacterium]HRI84461.1 adenylyl-sulfate kinase [Ignavibacteria bacterium]HRJ98420.1 adenylyl-sulfate kinase [Ignavibacteria bacterium]